MQHRLPPRHASEPPPSKRAELIDFDDLAGFFAEEGPVDELAVKHTAADLVGALAAKAALHVRLAERHKAEAEDAKALARAASLGLLADVTTERDKLRSESTALQMMHEQRVAEYETKVALLHGEVANLEAQVQLARVESSIWRERVAAFNMETRPERKRELCAQIADQLMEAMPGLRVLRVPAGKP